MNLGGFFPEAQNHLFPYWRDEEIIDNSEIREDNSVLNHYQIWTHPCLPQLHSFLCPSWQISTDSSTPDNVYPSSLSPRPERKVDLLFREPPLPSLPASTFIYCNSDTHLKCLLSTFLFISGILKTLLITLSECLNVYNSWSLHQPFCVCFSSENPQYHF